MSKQVKQQIISASKWSALTEVISKAVTPVTYILLALKLTPADFGIATIPIMLTAFCQILWDQGFSKAVVQSQENIDKVVNIAFWYNLGLSLFFYALLFLFSGQISSVFNTPEAAKVIRVQGLIVVLTAVISVYSSILIKTINFRSLFFSRLALAFITPLVSLPLAYLNFGYWSLVYGSLAGSLAQCVILVLKSDWRPVFDLNARTFRRILRFSLWSSGEGILSWFYLWFDSLIIGYYLQASELGLYRTGSLIVNSIFAVALSPVFPVLFATLAQHQHETETFNKIFKSATKIVIILSLLIGCVLFSTSELFVRIFLNDQWRGMALVIMVLGLSQSLSWLIATTTEAFRAKGLVNIVVQIMAFGTLYYIPAYIISSQHGLEKFLWVRLVLVMITIPLYILISVKFLRIKIVEIIVEMKYAFLGALIMLLLTWLWKESENHSHFDFAYNAIIAVVGISVYFFCLIPYRGYIRDVVLSIIHRKRN